MRNARPLAGYLCIGDEILGGKTRDANLHYLANWLTPRGVDLAQAVVVGDDASEIITHVLALSSRYDYVFTSGGIGPTHDDITVDAIAQAFACELTINEVAKASLKLTDNPEVNAMRLRMARVPKGARLIANTLSGPPGFAIHNVHVLAGVPSIFQNMLQNLDAHIHGGDVMQSLVLHTFCGESQIAKPLGDLQSRSAGIKIGSYPKVNDGGNSYVELVFRGTSVDALEACVAEAKVLLDRAGCSYQSP